MITLPTKAGRVEISEGSGRCLIGGCGIRGGGLVRFKREGKVTIVLCGDHLDRAMDVLFTALDERGVARMAEGS